MVADSLGASVGVVCRVAGGVSVVLAHRLTRMRFLHTDRNQRRNQSNRVCQYGDQRQVVRCETG